VSCFVCDQSFHSAQCIAVLLTLKIAHRRAANKSSSTRDYAKVVQQLQLLLEELDAALAKTVLSDQQKAWMRFTVLPAYECCRTCFEHLGDLQALHQVTPPSSQLVLLPGVMNQTKI